MIGQDQNFEKQTPIEVTGPKVTTQDRPKFEYPKVMFAEQILKYTKYYSEVATPRPMSGSQIRGPVAVYWEHIWGDGGLRGPLGLWHDSTHSMQLGRNVIVVFPKFLVFCYVTNCSLFLPDE